jgi:hypothetical protein
MWRSIFAVILLPSLTAAQSETTPSAPEDASSPARQTTAASQPSYEPYLFHNQIRRGTQEDALIRLSVQGLVTSPRSPVPGIVPLRLELRSADGLTVSSVRYPKTRRRKVKFQSEPVPVSGWPETSFKVRADKTAALGLHTLQGKLTFQVIDYKPVDRRTGSGNQRASPDHRGRAQCESGKGELAGRAPLGWDDRPDHLALAGGNPSSHPHPRGVRGEFTQLSRLGRAKVSGLAHSRVDSRKRLPHSSRFSTSGHHGPQSLVHSSSFTEPSP